MSVGKMNQLFNNEGYLTPEKRCSKGPFQYKYEVPKQFNVNSTFYPRSFNSETLFPYDSPSAPMPLDPRPLSSYKNFSVISHTNFSPIKDLRITEKIKSAKEIIESSKKAREKMKNFSIRKTQKLNQMALHSLTNDVEKIKSLSDELCYMKNFLRDRMSLSELN